MSAVQQLLLQVRYTHYFILLCFFSVTVYSLFIRGDSHLGEAEYEDRFTL